MNPQHKTLLLNATYEPLAVVSWRRAITMTFLQKIEVIENYDERIHSISSTWHLPAVARLLNYVKRRFQPIKFTHQNVYMRDHYICQYCGKHFAASKLTCDHIVPRSQGGQADWLNIVCCCIKCNNLKGDKTPAQAGMTLLSKPKKPTLPHSLKLVLGMNNTPETWKKYLYQK